MYIHSTHSAISGVRPFGVSLLIAGYDEVNGPSLYQVDPSGSYWAWKASAIGKNMINAKTFLEKRWVLFMQVTDMTCWWILLRYNEEMELEDAVHTAILTVSISNVVACRQRTYIILAQGRFRGTNDRK